MRARIRSVLWHGARTMSEADDSSAGKRVEAAMQERVPLLKAPAVKANYGINATVRPVTPLACASGAPSRPARYAFALGIRMAKAWIAATIAMSFAIVAYFAILDHVPQQLIYELGLAIPLIGGAAAHTSHRETSWASEPPPPFQPCFLVQGAITSPHEWVSVTPSDSRASCSVWDCLYRSSSGRRFSELGSGLGLRSVTQMHRDEVNSTVLALRRARRKSAYSRTRGRMPNKPIQLTVRVVTPRAVARVAPTRPAADRRRWTDYK
jgi:hypothetical protein